MGFPKLNMKNAIVFSVKNRLETQLSIRVSEFGRTSWIGFVSGAIKPNKRIKHISKTLFNHNSSFI